MSIMVGYVPTPVGEAAVAAAITEAKLRGEELLIVNSVREGSRVDKSVASDEDLSRLQKSAADAGITARVLRPSHRDDLADEILELAVEHDVSLIVIGLRQRTQVGKFIMGSHAQRILLQADRPVLAVKPDGRD
ncbi:universal stress protein [Arthrobacter parietis]|uniref:Universal stress protein n=2 Tax=Arthrobacter TaxID=1663 RepID=A0ABT6CY30_9MICC|nr:MULTISPECIES: universal stress protein [Arthrobacter]KRF09229.1 universal stress protein UspA [Arthrobacter sp. Soil782]MDF9278947.1 universal stress protein [Arthrobacter vasquezii]